MVSKTLKWGAVISFVAAMAVLLIGGRYALDKVPPYPEAVVADGGQLMSAASIMKGQQVYQRYGLMDHGSVWGHGSLRGHDFSAESLHIMALRLRDYYAKDRFGKDYAELDTAERGAVDALALHDIKTNTYDPQTGTLSLSPAQAFAVSEIKKFWQDTFRDGDTHHGYLPGAVPTEQERDAIGDFFFWTAWVAGTNRPDKNFTYTNNWPPDRLAGNELPQNAVIWSLFGLISLLGVLGFIIYVVHRYRFFYGDMNLVELARKIAAAPVSVSQRKAAKYLLIVILLFILQIFMGGLLAHYTVHPGAFYMQAIADFIPFSWVKSWHLQLGIFWIAVSWVGSALYLGPLIGGREPKGQGVLVDILFGAVLVVALGSLFGEVLGIKGFLSEKTWFWLGHQGWEYLELGRLWQILLFAGLIIWLGIAYRALAPRLARPEERAGGLTLFYVLSAIAVVLFFGFGLFYNQHSHITVADYWRWFVVHIWVEGIFEFFAAASLALLLTAVGLVSKESALRAAYLTAILSFSSGIVGTAHHYFWFGGPDIWIALGATFSSLEPIPMILLVVRGWMEYKHINDAGVNFPYRWPLMFLVASSFWNFLGAGVFGFLINLPVINYYEHATYLTSNHGHTALFGTYGMLSIALCLFTWRGLVREDRWNDGLLKLAFVGLNGGLFVMFLFTLLPVGVMQTAASYAHGMWYAKSSAFFDRPIVQFIGQIRMVPDLMIIVLGAFPLAAFFLRAFVNMKPAQVKGGEPIALEGDTEIPV
jgi:nitric oxide reductase subunit B